MWKALPNKCEKMSNVLIVADGSGSMTTQVDKASSVTALEVANALAIYFSERVTGHFKDKYITFSNQPRFVDLSYCETLRDKIITALRHCEIANTNIKATFDLILNTTIQNEICQNEMPSSFDTMTRGTPFNIK